MSKIFIPGLATLLFAQVGCAMELYYPSIGVNLSIEKIKSESKLGPTTKRRVHLKKSDKKENVYLLLTHVIWSNSVYGVARTFDKSSKTQVSAEILMDSLKKIVEYEKKEVRSELYLRSDNTEKDPVKSLIAKFLCHGYLEKKINEKYLKEIKKDFKDLNDERVTESKLFKQLNPKDL